VRLCAHRSNAQNLTLEVQTGELIMPAAYAVRVTQRHHPHFSFDAGIGQKAGTIGETEVPTGVPQAADGDCAGESEGAIGLWNGAEPAALRPAQTGA
jgi:hypothetical protein